MKRLSQSGSSNFCPELRKNALLISQSHFSNFSLHVITNKTALIRILTDELQTKADKVKLLNVNEVKTMNKISYLKNLSRRLVGGGGG